MAFQEDIAPISSAILNAQMKKYGFIYKTKVVGQPSWEHINLLNGGVIIYSKYPFAGSPQYLVFPRSYGVEGISNKGAVFVSINKDNKRYNIISLHTQSLSFPQYTTEEYTHWKTKLVHSISLLPTYNYQQMSHLLSLEILMLIVVRQ